MQVGIRLIKQRLPPVKTVLGISNISFGLPPAAREAVNSVFLYHCTKAGLDLAIVNAEKLERFASLDPTARSLAENLLFNAPVSGEPQDWRHQTREQRIALNQHHIGAITEYSRGVVKKKRAVQAQLPLDARLANYIIEGSKDGLIQDLDCKRAEGSGPLDIINGPLMRGMDEVGRGAWAGPIMVGAAVLPRDRRVYRVRDSKMLPEAERERLFDRIAAWCVAWAVGHASQQECDTMGMSAAQRLAASRAFDGLGLEPDAVLLDGRWDFVGAALDGCQVTRLVKGDATCLSIAAASILAKVTRDRMMRAEAPNFPGYDFDLNKGYPCPRHKTALKAWGPTSIHRRSWVFMQHLPWGVHHAEPEQAQLFFEDPEDPEGPRSPGSPGSPDGMEP